MMNRADRLDDLDRVDRPDLPRHARRSCLALARVIKSPVFSDVPEAGLLLAVAQ
jgi:hypothetical protein